MRLNYRSELSYVGRVIKETRVLVNCGHALHTKIALLESAIAEEQKRIALLETQITGASPARQARVNKMLELRRRALGHYRCTVKALLAKERRSIAFRNLPLLLGAPATTTFEAQTAGDPPFMEFSS